MKCPFGSRISKEEHTFSSLSPAVDLGKAPACHTMNEQLRGRGGGDRNTNDGNVAFFTHFCAIMKMLLRWIELLFSISSANNAGPVSDHFGL
jgi:hypothetical protein